ncbi:hypothetical protein [Faucicola boevrei]|uniref:hypothetical protein n=1 Tax=Faucicola boevrei TaxID=346665 RepID=UPI00035EC2B9|nr:hypothetical protein [Moraxella boevrei]
MEKFALITLVAVTSFANAQDIPKAFQGKWVTSAIKYEQLSPKLVKHYCNPKMESDGAVILTVSNKNMEMNYWEASETVNNFKFSQVKPNYILGTARFVQSGFVGDEEGNLIDKDIILNRKIEFTLKNGELIELYRNDQNEIGKPIWYKRYWKKCN